MRKTITIAECLIHFLATLRSSDMYVISYYAIIDRFLVLSTSRP